MKRLLTLLVVNTLAFQLAVPAAADGVLLSKDGTKLIHYPAKKNGSAYIIQNGVAWIESGAFHNCTNLKSISIPGNVTDIQLETFSGCVNLTSVTIPASVTNIGITTLRQLRQADSVLCGQRQYDLQTVSCSPATARC